ncbi:MAG: hypothetical protein QOD92_4139 [Acidimicrobiaceae bacterium]|jgi:hypothetical protein
MFEGIRSIERELAGVVGDLNPNTVPSESLVPLFEHFDRIERHAATAKILLARRIDESERWKRHGYASAAEYLAAKAGSSVGAAKDTLATSAAITNLPLVEQAMRDGEISEQQAVLIADAAAAAPNKQHGLINEAKKSSHKELKDACHRVKASADPNREATHRRLHSERHVRTFADKEGAWNLRARGTADAGARIEAALRLLIDEQFAKARAEGRRESRDAYAFDALVELADAYGDTEAERDVESESESSVGPHRAIRARRRRRQPHHLMLLRVDLEALRRGAAEDGEYCEITGIGPVPVSVARALLTDAIVKLVITKGTDVLNVTSLGRGPNAAQRIALLWQQPLCTVEGCCSTRCEIDHRIEFRKTKHTRLDECDPLCKHHHDLKTYDGWKLVEGTGKRPMVPPDDPRHPDNGPEP